MTAMCSLSLSIELQSDCERIGGRLRDQNGNDWQFSSWLDLLTLIERMRASAASPTDEPEKEEAR